ncbi:hypothetical protein SLA2020_056060 [Shorea laevis]
MDIITTSQTSSAAPPSISAILIQEPPSLNMMVTNTDSHFTEISSPNPSQSDDHFSGPQRSIQYQDLGLLSQKVESQLSLGAKPIKTRKRSLDREPFTDIFKRACRRNDDDGLHCSPNQMQEALSLGRSDLHKQDQAGFFTNVVESITVQKVRRRIRSKALNRQIKFQPDPRFNLLNQFHPTQRSFEDPPFVPFVPIIGSAPGILLPYLNTSSSNLTEQSPHDNHDYGALVAGPWQPPPST